MCFIGDFSVTDQPKGVQRCQTEGILGNLIQIKNGKSVHMFSAPFIRVPLNKMQTVAFTNLQMLACLINPQKYMLHFGIVAMGNMQSADILF